MLYELENDLTPCYQPNYPTCNLTVSPCKFSVAWRELKHVSSLIHVPALCPKTSRRRRKRQREIKLILWKVLINVVCESQNYVNNLILHSARFHSTVDVFDRKFHQTWRHFTNRRLKASCLLEKFFVEIQLRCCGVVEISRKGFLHGCFEFWQKVFNFWGQNRN